MRNPVIVDAARTVYGKRGGALSGVHAVELLAGAQVALLERTGVDPALVGETIGDVDAIDERERRDQTFGMVAICAGGAQATGTIIERI